MRCREPRVAERGRLGARRGEAPPRRASRRGVASARVEEGPRYAHYDEDPSFDDFEAFGGWSSPAMKQYNDGPATCGLALDYNYKPKALANATSAQWCCSGGVAPQADCAGLDQHDCEFHAATGAEIDEGIPRRAPRRKHRSRSAHGARTTAEP